MLHRHFRLILTVLLAACCATGTAAISIDQAPVRLLAELDLYSHLERVDTRRERVLDHEIGLGAIQKVRGAWQLKASERLSGDLLVYTWRIIDGFTSEELLSEAEAKVSAFEGSELLFSCDARACGRSVQWANRVFRQRLLYGTEASQSYRVYALTGAGGERFRLVMYASARSSDRQYLHMELLEMASEAAAAP